MEEACLGAGLDEVSWEEGGRSSTANNTVCFSLAFSLCLPMFCVCVYVCVVLTQLGKGKQWEHRQETYHHSKNASQAQVTHCSDVRVGWMEIDVTRESHL